MIDDVFAVEGGYHHREPLNGQPGAHPLSCPTDPQADPRLEGDPYLCVDGVLARAEKGFDPEVLFDPLTGIVH